MCGPDEPSVCLMDLVGTISPAIRKSPLAKLQKVSLVC